MYVLGLKGRDYVTLAVVAGLSPTMIMWQHIFPNVVNTVPKCKSSELDGPGDFSFP